MIRSNITITQVSIDHQNQNLQVGTMWDSYIFNFSITNIYKLYITAYVLLICVLRLKYRFISKNINLCIKLCVVKYFSITFTMDELFRELVSDNN